MKTNKKIRTAIIGLGKIAWAYEDDPVIGKSDDFPTHFMVLRHNPHFKLVGAQDNNAVARNNFSKKLKKHRVDARIYQHWEEMIQKEKPELLVVASNTESHVAICSRAIDMGIKNILCEKPLSYSLKDAKRLVKKAEKSKCVLFVNYPRAFNPSYIALCRKIQQGYLGRIQTFDIKYSKGIFNNGTHSIDLLIRMFGAVSKVQGSKNLTHKTNTVDPTVSALIEFKNGVRGYIHGLNNDFYGVFELDILGERGRVKIVSDKALLFIRKNINGRNVLAAVLKNNLINTQKGLYPVYDSVQRSIVSGGKVDTASSGNDSLRSLEAAEKIVKSIKN